MVIANVRDADAFLAQVKDDLDNTGLNEIDDVQALKHLLETAETARQSILDMQDALSKAKKTTEWLGLLVGWVKTSGISSTDLHLD